MSAIRPIADGWQFRQVNGSQDYEQWLPVSEFPTTVHVELLKSKRIPDPVRLRGGYSAGRCTDWFPPAHRLERVGSAV